MAYTAYKTYVAGSVLTAAELNTYQRDNGLALIAGEVPFAQLTLDGAASDPSVSGSGDAVLFYHSGLDEWRESRNGSSFKTFGGSLVSTFRGLHLRTHPDVDLRGDQVELVHADEVIFNDGKSVRTGLDRLVADITASGAGGLDTGSRVASTWYEVHVIRKSSDGTLNLLLHRSKSYTLDQSQLTTPWYNSLRDVSGKQQLAQGFQVASASPIEIVDVPIIRVGTISAGKAMWLEIYADSGGSPTGSALATSDKLDASVVSTGTAPWTRFVFRTPMTPATSTQYHLVLRGDFTVDGSNFLLWAGATTNVYASGVSKQYDGASWSVSGTYSGTAVVDHSFRIYTTQNDAALTLPSGYDESCKVGYVYNDSGDVLQPMVAMDRRVMQTVNASATVTGSQSPVGWDLSALVPPGPVAVRFLLSHSANGGYIFVGAVPDGYCTYSNARSPGFVAGALIATANQQVTSDLYLTEFQYAYLNASGSTGTARFLSYDWF